MKTLYVSDLDGTLLDNNAEVMPKTAEIINNVIKKGILFSAATARTAATAVPITSCIDINLPIVIMNGAALYDIKNKEYLSVKYIPQAAVSGITSAAEKCGINGFAYTIDGNAFNAWYDELSTKAMRDFYTERRQKFNKPFTRLSSLSKVCGKPVVYFSFSGSEDRLAPLYNAVCGIDGIKTEYYGDVYSSGNMYLEILSANASKQRGVDFLRRYTNADYVVGFGDNLNDLSLFAACDECYAVKNADGKLKKTADGIVGANTENGVAEFLMSVCERLD